MNSKLSYAMDKIPRQRSFVCLSLKFGCIVSALIIILYSVLSLAQCLAAFNMLPDSSTPDDIGFQIVYGVLISVTVAHTITFALTAIMLVGVLREKGNLIRPWIVWTSIKLTVYVLFMFWTTLGIINHPGGNTLLLYTIDFMTLIIRFYMLMTVASYYKELMEEEDENDRLRNLVNSETWYSAA